MDGGAWWAAVHGVAKSRTRLSDFTLTFHFHALEKEMATHSSVQRQGLAGPQAARLAEPALADGSGAGGGGAVPQPYLYPLIPVF